MPFCSSCGAENPEGAKFCARCGQGMAQSAAPVKPAQASAKPAAPRVQPPPEQKPAPGVAQAPAKPRVQPAPAQSPQPAQPQITAKEALASPPVPKPSDVPGGPDPNAPGQTQFFMAMAGVSTGSKIRRIILFVVIAIVAGIGLVLLIQHAFLGPDKPLVPPKKAPAIETMAAPEPETTEPEPAKVQEKATTQKPKPKHKKKRRR